MFDKRSYLCSRSRLIKHNATSGNYSSYMLSYMHPVYRAGQSDSGMWAFATEMAHSKSMANVSMSRRNGRYGPESLQNLCTCQ